MMYGMCGVNQPAVDGGTVVTRGDDYAALASATESTLTTTTTVITEVLAQNDGRGAQGFEKAAGYVARQFTALQGAAHRTAEAYRAAGMVGASAKTAMDSLNRDATIAYWRGMQSPVASHQLVLLVQVTRNQLLRIEACAVSTISGAFSGLNLPETMSVQASDGKLDPQVEQAWENMTDEQRKEVLQNIADAYADANGYPRIDVTYASIESDPGTVTWGDYRNSPERLRLNSDQLSDPHLMNTVVHEVEHRGQYQGMGSRWPWQDERAGMSRAEAERWKQLNAGHVRQRGGSSKEEYYPPRPIEVHAREAGREFVNNMSYEEFLGYR